LRYSQSQAALYQYLEQAEPEFFARLQKLVKDGRWDIVGGAWVENDLNLSGGEATVRQLLHGQHYYRDKFGKEALVAWAPDTFGHPWTMPQIYSKAHLKYHAFSRCGKNKLVFDWQGPDGSKIHSYDVGVLLSFLDMAKDIKDVASGKEKFKETFEKMGLDCLAVGFGEGDHGGGPSDDEMMYINMAGMPMLKKAKLPKPVLSRADEAMQKMVEATKDIPVIDDELNYVFRGCFSSQAEVKRRNRMSEQLLDIAERLSALSSIAYGAAFPTDELKSAWEKTMFNQFHDILPGTCVNKVYPDVHKLYSEVEETADSAIIKAFKPVAEGRQLPMAQSLMVVFNPCPWTRDAAVEAVIDFKGKNKPTGVTLEPVGGPDTESIKGQFLNTMSVYKSLNRRRCIFAVKNLPPMGIRFYRINGLVGEKTSLSGGQLRVPPHEIINKSYREKNTLWEVPAPQKTSEGATLKATENSLENAYYTVTVNPQTGGISSILDKKNNRELVLKGEEVNVIKVYPDDDSGYSAWEIKAGEGKPLGKPAYVKMVENGPVRATIQVGYNYGQSRIEQRISLYEHLDIVEFSNQTEWRERAKTLKVRFPVEVGGTAAQPAAKAEPKPAPTADAKPAQEKGAEITVTVKKPEDTAAPAAAGDSTVQFVREIPYGWIKSANDGSEVPAQKWVDITGPKGGVSILNDSRYGHDAKGSDIGITLLRSSVAPDPVADMGIHATGYALWSHGPEWKASESAHRGIDFNSPALAYAKGPTPIGVAVPPLTEQPEVITSLLSVDKPNVIVSAFKKAHKGDDYVLRVYECDGAPETEVTLKLNFPVNSVVEADLLEDKTADAACANGELKFKIGKFEIKTFKMNVTPSAPPKAQAAKPADEAEQPKAEGEK